jgi:folylpolyglutamate synthase/dihydropteroate synthase
VFGVSQDKDIKGILSQLCGLAHKIILTAADNPRAAKPEYLQRFLTDKRKEVFLTSGVKEAKTLALRISGKEDLILVTGSLFVVGEFRDAYR